MAGEAENGIITDYAKARDLIESLLKLNYITLDLEGKDLGDSKNGYIRLIQLCGRENDVILLDAKKIEPQIIETDFFKNLMESETIIKVVHGAINDTKMLFEKHKIKLKNIFDTQLLQKVLTSLEEKKDPKLIDWIGLLDLCQRYDVVYPCIERKLEMQQVLKKDKKFCPWTEDVLPEKWIEYAKADASVLIPLYGKMKSHFRSKEIQKLYEEICDDNLYPRKHRMKTRSKTKSNPSTSKSTRKADGDQQMVDGVKSLDIGVKSGKPHYKVRTSEHVQTHAKCSGKVNGPVLAQNAMTDDMEVTEYSPNKSMKNTPMEVEYLDVPGAAMGAESIQTVEGTSTKTNLKAKEKKTSPSGSPYQRKKKF